MSIIGRIGQFLIDNQELIGAIILIAFAIILIWLLAKLIIKNTKKNKEIEEAEAARTKLLEELIEVSKENNKELLAAIARVNDIDNKVEKINEKQGAIDDELLRQLERVAGGTVEEILAKALPTAREADEESKKAVETPAPAPVAEVEPVVEPTPVIVEPVAEPNPVVVEPVAEPTPVVVEPVAEPTPTVTFEPIVEQTPIAEPAPVVEPTPVVAQPEYFAPQREPVIADAEKVDPVLAYTKRDAGIDKHGNVYTEEMLRDQIG